MNSFLWTEKKASPPEMEALHGQKISPLVQKKREMVTPKAKSMFYLSLQAEPTVLPFLLAQNLVPRTLPEVTSQVESCMMYISTSLLEESSML